MPLSFSPFYPLFFCQLNIPQPNCSPHFWSNLRRPVSRPCFIYFFAGCCVITLFIYLNDFALLKNHKSKQKSHLKYFCACKNQWSKSDACLSHELCACDSPLGHGAITRCFFHGTLPCPLFRMQLLRYCLCIPHFAPKFPVPLPVCWSCFHPCLLPHWHPVPISMSFCPGLR